MTALIAITMFLILGGLALTVFAMTTLAQGVDLFDETQARSTLLIVVGGPMIGLGLLTGFFTLMVAAINTHATNLAAIGNR